MKKMKIEVYQTLEDNIIKIWKKRNLTVEKIIVRGLGKNKYSWTIIAKKSE